MKTNYCSFSIVIPSFNQGQYIEETLCSLLDQKYPYLEIIVMDGGSTDNTVDIINKYNKHIKFWVSEKDSGQTDAINKGFKYCTGEWFNWLNSDDYLSKDSLWVLNDYISKQPDLNLIMGQFEYLYEDGKNELFKPKGIFPSVKNTLRYGFIKQPTTFFKLDYVHQYFPLNVELKYCMDFELWYKVFVSDNNLNCLEINDLIATYRIHGNSKTFTSNEKFVNEHLFLLSSLAASTPNSSLEKLFKKLDFAIEPISFNISNKKYSDVEFLIFDRMLKKLTPVYNKNDFSLLKHIIGNAKNNNIFLPKSSWISLVSKCPNWDAFKLYRKVRDVSGLSIYST